MHSSLHVHEKARCQDKCMEVDPDMKPEWLAAAILEGTGEETAIIQDSKTQQLNWWAFVVEILPFTVKRVLRSYSLR